MPRPSPTIPVVGFIDDTGSARMADIDRDQPSDKDGIWWEDVYGRLAWTPLGFIRRGDRFILNCACGHRQDAPLQKLVDEGRGDTPMHLFRGKWRCSRCGGRDIKIEVQQRSA